MQYLKLNNSLYYDIEIDEKNIPSFLIEDKRCDKIPLVALNNMNVDDEIPLIVEKNNSSGAEAEGGLLSIPNNILIPIILENFNDNQGNYPIKTEGKEEKMVLTVTTTLQILFILELMVLLRSMVKES